MWEGRTWPRFRPIARPERSFAMVVLSLRSVCCSLCVGCGGVGGVAAKKCGLGKRAWKRGAVGLGVDGTLGGEVWLFVFANGVADI